MSLLALIRVLRARAVIIFWAVLVACVAAWLVSRLVPQTYTSSATVQADSIQENLLTGMVEPRLRVSEFLGQQAAIISSRTVALQVIEVLEAENYVSRAQYEQDWRAATGGEIVPGSDARLWFADRLAKRLSVKANVDHSTLIISYTSENPSRASRYANAFADAYM
ncbi:Wzz/FepE/Etk N-terminal domain-containing protein [Parvularcula sp. IMCC14364]|uniref:Wzz/FepE/Etk N-terminal domain-containing protein n=1 Tax=Parvularcula sp. IMCC14364 TaxID=3067902 RepID=UPI00274292DD|nr:Wzz/FepE/Etk N-terminal domain-containing protein [Parvularcula sp. IMCC14364]